MNGWRNIIGVGTLLVVGFGTVTSCIIPDKGIQLVQVCGKRWYGTANGAKGVNQNGNLVDILVSSDWVTGGVCVWPTEHQALNGLVQQDCLQYDEENDCEQATGCEWSTWS